MAGEGVHGADWGSVAAAGLGSDPGTVSVPDSRFSFRQRQRIRQPHGGPTLKQAADRTDQVAIPFKRQILAWYRIAGSGNGRLPAGLVPRRSSTLPKRLNPNSRRLKLGARDNSSFRRPPKETPVVSGVKLVWELLTGAAKTHSARGIAPEHFDVFADTLIKTLREICEKEETIAAWRAVLAPAIRYLQHGARTSPQANVH